MSILQLPQLIRLISDAFVMISFQDFYEKFCSNKIGKSTVNNSDPNVEEKLPASNVKNARRNWALQYISSN